MSTTINPTLTTAPDDVAVDADALAARLIGDVATVLETLSTELGLRLGLYAALDELGPSTPARLAARTGLNARMVREWCEQQTAAGMLACPDPDRAPTDRAFVLPPATTEALLRHDGDAWVAPLVQLLPGITGVLDDVARSFHDGRGVPFHAYGAPVRHGLGELNGASFDAALAGWLADVPEARRRLAGDAPRVLDLGSGTGRSSVALAQAHPGVQVLGVDLDEASIAEARALAAAAGVDDRVQFRVGDAATVEVEDGTFDVVTILEALHDIGDPVGTLRRARTALAPGGVAYITDERVADHFGADAELNERLQYGFSVLHCLPATLAEDPVLAQGTILRAPTLLGWAHESGFSEARRLDVEDVFWQHYALLA